MVWSCRSRTQPKTNMGSTYRPCLEPRSVEKRARRQGSVGALFLFSYCVPGGSGSAVPRWSMRCANQHVLAGYSALLLSNLLTGSPFPIGPKAPNPECQPGCSICFCHFCRQLLNSKSSHYRSPTNIVVSIFIPFIPSLVARGGLGSQR